MSPASVIKEDEEMGPTESIVWALMQFGGQIMVITNHMARSLEEGGATEGDRFDHVLARLLTETWEADRDRPSRRDLATAARVVKWASEVTAEEICLIPHDLKLEDFDDCLDRLPPDDGVHVSELRKPTKRQRRPS